MSKLFINRIDEIKLLEDRYRSGKAEFVVMYGRRRVGKTALILKFLEDKEGVYLLARETSDTENLKRFSQKIAEYFEDNFLLKNPFRNWDAFFEYLAKIDDRFILAIDEFPYLVKANPALPSILQEYWDIKLNNTRLFIIICGSAVSMMEKLLGYKSPIYGRRTAQLRLKPLSFFQIREFFPSYDWEDLVKVYGILGGIPAYLLEFDDRFSVEENLMRYLKVDSILYQDALFILREELEDPKNYFAIIEAIAKGRNTLGEIVNETGLDRSLVGKYLSVLRELDIVRREIPITESYKSRKGRYFINDFYFNFWFRFIYPNADLIESGSSELLLDIIMREFDQYLGIVFEDVAKQFLIKLNKRGMLPFKFTKIGKWWYKNKEIDLVALNEKEERVLFVEVKWSNLRERDTERILKNLERIVKLTGLNNYKKYFGVIGKRVSSKGDLLWDLKDFSKTLVTTKSNIN